MDHVYFHCMFLDGGTSDGVGYRRLSILDDILSCTPLRPVLARLVSHRIQSLCVYGDRKYGEAYSVLCNLLK